MISASAAITRLTQRLQNSRFGRADRRRILHGAYVDVMRPPTERRPGGEFRRLMAGPPVEGVEFAQGLVRLLVKEGCFHLIDPLNTRVHQLWIEELPPNQEHLQILSNLYYCNLDRDTVIQGYRGYRPYAIARGVANLYFDPMPEFYVFSKPQRGLLDLPIGVDKSLRLVLDPALYGFSDDMVVTLNPKPMFEKPAFTPAYDALYTRLQASGSYILPHLLEAVGAIVNGSMAYDFDNMPDPVPASAYPGPLPFSRQRLAAAHPPRGDETLLGMCSDAGHLIRRVLLSLQPQKTLLIADLTTQAKGFSHDVTLVFDTVTSRWALINARSPLKPYNLIPKERLVDLGRFADAH